MGVFQYFSFVSWLNVFVLLCVIWYFNLGAFECLIVFSLQMAVSVGCIMCIWLCSCFRVQQSTPWYGKYYNSLRAMAVNQIAKATKQAVQAQMQAINTQMIKPINAAKKKVIAVKTHVVTHKSRYTFAAVLVIGFFALLTFRSRIKKLVGKLVSKAKAEGKTDVDKSALLDGLLAILTGLALVIGTIGVVIDPKTIKDLMLSLRNISTIRAALSVSTGALSFMLDGFIMSLECVGITTFFPKMERTLARLSSGSKHVDDVVDITKLSDKEIAQFSTFISSKPEATETEKKQFLDTVARKKLEQKNLKKYIRDGIKDRRDQDVVFEDKEKEKETDEEEGGEDIEDEEEEDVVKCYILPRSATVTGFFGWPKPGIVYCSPVDIDLIHMQSGNTCSLEKGKLYRYTNKNYVEVSKAECKGLKLGSATPLEDFETVHVHASRINTSNLIFAPEEDADTYFSFVIKEDYADWKDEKDVEPMEDFENISLLSKLYRSTFVRWTAVLVMLVGLSLAGYYLYEYTWNTKKLTAESKIKVLEDVQPECIHLPNCPKKLPCLSGKPCNQVCGGHNCTHFSSCKPVEQVKGECVHLDSCPKKLGMSVGSPCNQSCGGHYCTHFVTCAPAGNKPLVKKLPKVVEEGKQRKRRRGASMTPEEYDQWLKKERQRAVEELSYDFDDARRLYDRADLEEDERTLLLTHDREEYGFDGEYPTDYRSRSRDYTSSWYDQVDEDDIQNFSGKQNWGDYMDEYDAWKRRNFIKGKRSQGECLLGTAVKIIVFIRFLNWVTQPRGESKQPVVDKIREAPKKVKAKDTAPKTRGKKIVTKTKVSEKGKEKEKEKEREPTNFNVPCKRQGCPGTYVRIMRGKDKQPLIDDKTGQYKQVTVKCKYVHPMPSNPSLVAKPESLVYEATPESKIKTSLIIPTNIRPENHSMVSIKKGDKYTPSGNGFCVGGAFLTEKHVAPGPVCLLTNKIDGELVTQELKIKQYRNDEHSEIMVGSKPQGVSSYKAAVPVIGELCYLAAWDISNESNPVFTITTGFVEDKKSDYIKMQPNHLTHTCTSHAGMSAGPLFNQQGQVIGMHWGGMGEFAYANAFIPFTNQLIMDFSNGGWSRPQ